MLEAWNNACLYLGDLLLGWSLGLPTDLTLFVVAVLSAAVLTLVRLGTTNQDRLRRVAADRKQLKQLMREAKSRRDREAVARHRRTTSMVTLIALKAEGLPLLVAILPIAVLATWAALRLDFHPPQAGKALELALYTPVSAEAELAHVVPLDGVESDGWVKRIDAVTDEGPPHGMAVWELAPAASPEPYELVLRFRGRNLTHPVLVGQSTYTPPILDHGGEVLTETRLRQVKLFDVVPGIPAIFFPPWLVAYLLITIPFVFVLKPLLRIR
jgi:uncharacterized membrane protein (DUF106 family)